MRKTVLAWLLLFGALTAQAETLYISDELTVPLRRGPSNGHRIINAALPSGTALEVLGRDEAAGFTQVRTPNGTEGWVPSQYLAQRPPARDQLAAANKRIESLEAQLKSLRENYQNVRGDRSEIEGRANDLSKQTEKLQNELNDLRRISGTAVQNYQENQQLKTANQSLTAQVSELSAQVRQLERNVMVRSLLSGGGLVLIGLLLGAWIKARPKRSTWA